MAEAPRPLLAWSLAGFHVALLVAVVIAGLSLAGRAGDLLSGLDTLAGLGLYGYLWAATWWTNRRWLAAAAPAMIDGQPDSAVAIAGAAKWGGVTGLLLVAAPLVVAAGFLVAGGGLGAIPFVLLGAAVGALIAAAIGAGVGGLFAALDLLLLRASGVVVPDGGT